MSDDIGSTEDFTNDDDNFNDSAIKWIALSTIACISFWCQSVVTEERLVPALNVISDYHGVPDEIAGRTLMAAGASSPELVCTLLSIFITHSSLGLGTIVGSVIFNQSVICAGSVYASKPKLHPYNVNPNTSSRNTEEIKYLVLDKVMIIREVGFYALSIGLLYVALSESRCEYNDNNNNGNQNSDGNEEYGVEHIYVSFWRASVLLGGYILYVVVCSNMEKCMALAAYLQRLLGFSGASSSDDKAIQLDKTKASYPSNDEWSMAENESIHYKSFEDDIHQLPFIYNISTEPVENWEVGTASYNLDEQHYNDADIIITNSSNSDYNNIRLDSNQTSEDSFDENKIIAKASCTSLKPIGANKDHIVTNDIYEMTNSDGINELGCFLWQRSIFYSKAYFGAHGFHLRWFSITPKRISSVPDRRNLEKHTMVYPQFNEVHIDEKRLIINIVHPVKGKRDFTLMAPNKAVFDEVTHAFQVYMSTNRNLGLDGVTCLDTYDDKKNERNNDADPHLELIEFPSHANKLETALWIFLLPIRVIMHYTLPDVRHLDRQGNPTKSVGHAYISVIMCLIWLILSSYAMVASLEALATLMAVIQPLTKRLHKLLGLTVSAAGTSMPSLVASRIASEKGFGNQAVHNVFASNTFNICVGLGLPWVLYTMGHGFQPYHDLENNQMLDILILTVFLLVFVVLMISSNFVLLKWHADLFIGLYVTYVVLAVGQVFVS